MGQTNEELTENLAERWWWEVARRDEARIARRLSRRQVVDGVYRLDEGAVLDEFCHFLRAIGAMALLEDVHGTALQRAMLPSVQYVLLYGLKTLFAIRSMNALPTLLFSDEARMPWVGFNAQQVRDGGCQRGAATRPRGREPGPICPDTLAQQIVRLNLRELESLLNGAIRALAQAGVLEAQVPGMMDGPDLETTARYRGCGQVTRKRRLEDRRGQGHALEVTVSGWKVLLFSDAATKIPLAVTGGKIHEHEPPWTRALVTQARAHLARYTRRHKVVFEKGVWDGTDRWWLDQQGLTCAVPAKTNMAVTADARAQAMVGESRRVGRRVPTVRHGQGSTARAEKLETEVVGIAGLPPEDQDGTPEPGRHHPRRDFQPHPINAVVVRQWHGRD